MRRRVVPRAAGLEGSEGTRLRRRSTATRAGKRSCACPRPKILFRERRASRSGVGNKASRLIFSAGAKGGKNKDRAIREKQEAKLLADLTRLQQRVSKGQLKDDTKIHQAIGRLRERYPRVARYGAIEFDSAEKQLAWQEVAEKKAIAQKLDGSYVLRTDRPDLSAEEAWRAYILLTRVEDAFRDMKSPLMERPIFHHLKNRTQTPIFLYILAYHLLAAIEHRFLQAGVPTS